MFQRFSPYFPLRSPPPQVWDIPSHNVIEVLDTSEDDILNLAAGLDEKGVEITFKELSVSGDLEQTAIFPTASNIGKPFLMIGHLFRRLHKRAFKVESPRVPEVEDFTYIVIGWFPKAEDSPREQLIWLEKKTDVLETLQRSIATLRGWNNVISLKSLRAFSLYKVSPVLLPHHTKAHCLKVRLQDSLSYPAPSL